MLFFLLYCKLKLWILNTVPKPFQVFWPWILSTSTAIRRENSGEGLKFWKKMPLFLALSLILCELRRHLTCVFFLSCKCIQEASSEAEFITWLVMTFWSHSWASENFPSRDWVTEAKEQQERASVHKVLNPRIQDLVGKWVALYAGK